MRIAAAVLVAALAICGSHAQISDEYNDGDNFLSNLKLEALDEDATFVVLKADESVLKADESLPPGPSWSVVLGIFGNPETAPHILDISPALLFWMRQHITAEMTGSNENFCRRFKTPEATKKNINDFADNPGMQEKVKANLERHNEACVMEFMKLILRVDLGQSHYASGLEEGTPSERAQQFKLIIQFMDSYLLENFFKVFKWDEDKTEFKIQDNSMIKTTSLFAPSWMRSISALETMQKHLENDLVKFNSMGFGLQSASAGPKAIILATEELQKQRKKAPPQAGNAHEELEEHIDALAADLARLA